jgi:hypothetical protein
LDEPAASFLAPRNSTTHPFFLPANPNQLPTLSPSPPPPFSNLDIVATVFLFFQHRSVVPNCWQYLTLARGPSGTTEGVSKNLVLRVFAATTAANNDRGSRYSIGLATQPSPFTRFTTRHYLNILPSRSQPSILQPLPSSSEETRIRCNLSISDGFVGLLRRSEKFDASCQRPFRHSFPNNGAFNDHNLSIQVHLLAFEAKV